MTASLIEQAEGTIASAEFRTLWALDARKILARAANTEGSLPPYAVNQVVWALWQARDTERRCEREHRAAEAEATQQRGLR